MTIDAGHDGEIGLTTWFRDGVLYVSGEIDISSCSTFRRVVMEHATSSIVIGMAGVSFCDSSCLGVILELIRAGREVTILHPQPTVRRVLEVVGALQLDRLHVI